jgi:hypothetical protein
MEYFGQKPPAIGEDEDLKPFADSLQGFLKSVHLFVKKVINVWQEVEQQEEATRRKLAAAAAAASSSAAKEAWRWRDADGRQMRQRTGSKERQLTQEAGKGGSEQRTSEQRACAKGGGKGGNLAKEAALRNWRLPAEGASLAAAEEVACQDQSRPFLPPPPEEGRARDPPLTGDRLPEEGSGSCGVDERASSPSQGSAADDAAAGAGKDEAAGTVRCFFLPTADPDRTVEFFDIAEEDADDTDSCDTCTTREADPDWERALDIMD